MTITMPVFIYAHINSSIKDSIDQLWTQLKSGVTSGAISDLASLQYPPHITLSGSFDESKIDMKSLQKDLEQTFGHDISGPVSCDIIRSTEIHSIGLVWPAMSNRIAQLKRKYPSIPWSTTGYHCTLVHGGTVDTMKMTARAVPILTDSIRSQLESTCYQVTMWKWENVQGTNLRSWETRKWSPMWSCNLTGL